MPYERKKHNQASPASVTNKSSLLPPQNLDAEQSVLGALMLDKDAIIKVADVLRPEDFYRGIHGDIFRGMMELYDKNEPIDLLSLTNKLEEKKLLERIGGSSYLADLTAAVATAAHIAHYAKIIRNKKVLRDLINVSQDITELSYAEPEDIDTLMDNVEQKIFSVSQRSISQRFTPIKDSLEEAYERIQKIHDEGGRTRGVPTGFKGLDNCLSGFQGSDLIILAARPSIGKTTLALDFVRHAAIDNKLATAIFSIEMSKDQLTDRMISAEGAIDLWKLRTGKLSEDELAAIPNSLDKLSQAPIFIDDTPSPTIMQMRAMARRLQAEHDLKLIVVDYLQLIQPSSTFAQPVQQVTEISRGLKTLARELNVPVIALSQLSRAVESRSPAIPKLSDLRESGSLEQDADVVLLIYREDKDRGYGQSDESTGPNKVAKILIAKHRNGPTGEVKLAFQEDKVRFVDLEDDQLADF